MKQTATVFAIVAILLGVSAGCGAQEYQLKGETSMQEIVDQVREAAGDWYVQMPQTVDKTSLVDLFQIDPSIVVEFAGDYSITMTSADHFLAIRAKDGRSEEIRAALENRRAQMEQTFEQYLPGPLKVARAGKVMVLGNYVFLIVMGNPDGDPSQEVQLVEAAIRSFFEEPS